MGVGVLSGTGVSVGNGTAVGVCEAVGCGVVVGNGVAVGAGVSVRGGEVEETGTTVGECVAGGVLFDGGDVEVMTSRSSGGRACEGRIQKNTKRKSNKRITATIN